MKTKGKLPNNDLKHTLRLVIDHTTLYLDIAKAKKQQVSPVDDASGAQCENCGQQIVEVGVVTDLMKDACGARVAFVQCSSCDETYEAVEVL